MARPPSVFVEDGHPISLFYRRWPKYMYGHHRSTISLAGPWQRQHPTAGNAALLGHDAQSLKGAPQGPRSVAVIFGRLVDRIRVFWLVGEVGLKKRGCIINSDICRSKAAMRSSRLLVLIIHSSGGIIPRNGRVRKSRINTSVLPAG